MEGFNNRYDARARELYRRDAFDRMNDPGRIDDPYGRPPPKEVRLYELFFALERLQAEEAIGRCPPLDAKDVKPIDFAKVGQAATCDLLASIVREGVTLKNAWQYCDCLERLETAGEEFQKIARSAIVLAAHDASILPRAWRVTPQEGPRRDFIADAERAIMRILHPLDRNPGLREMVYESATFVIRDRMRGDRHTGNGYQARIRDRVTDNEGNEVMPPEVAPYGFFPPPEVAPYGFAVALLTWQILLAVHLEEREERNDLPEPIGARVEGQSDNDLDDLH